ncbi:hypothetical protein K3Z95_27490, partial [Pseudomonas aeruginosa]|nr:hypothetical protein [Pseudomonas aeruginosa]
RLIGRDALRLAREHDSLIFEAECLRQALGQCRGDIKAVMELLQLPRRTLNEKMLRHGLSRSDFVGEEPA